MSSDTQTHSLDSLTHSHIIKPPTAGVRQVGHTSKRHLFIDFFMAIGKMSAVYMLAKMLNIVNGLLCVATNGHFYRIIDGYQVN